MQQALELINKLYQQWKGREAASVDILPKSGSERRYFRVHEQDGGTIIATLGANVQENETLMSMRHTRSGAERANGGDGAGPAC